MDYKVISVDGKAEEKKGKIGLRQAQQIVGGYVEVIRVQGGFLLVDEEARLKAKQIPNQVASELAGQTILGTAIFLKKMSTLSE